MSEASASDDRQRLLRGLPSVDALSRREGLRERPGVVDATRFVLDEMRGRILSANGSAPSEPPSLEHLTQLVANRLDARAARRHRRVRNGTGIVLHTGLGRAPLGEAAVEAVVDAAGCAVVEIDLESGKRDRREDGVRELLCELTGRDGALAVNNNAAAMNLALRALAEDREVVISRGELVEIGGGFRMPDVMAVAGCRMVEVGATNRTRIDDYDRAIGPETALLTKVHPSNYRIEGFSYIPSLEELVALGRKRGVAVLEDLGSGLLTREIPEALADEPRVLDSARSGAEVVCFSGDKLLGGPQCGLLIGDAEVIETIRRHPLYRAFRCDKITLAALEATLRVYRDGDPLREIPTLRRIHRSADELRPAAEEIAAAVGRGALVIETESFVGSGANPARPIPSVAVALDGGEDLAQAYRTMKNEPIFPRLRDGRVVFDLRTLFEEDRARLIEDLGAIHDSHQR